MEMLKLLLPNNGKIHPAQVQKWLFENKIKHGPTVKSSNGWTFHFFSSEDAMATKIMWS